MTPNHVSIDLHVTGILVGIAGLLKHTRRYRPREEGTITEAECLERSEVDFAVPRCVSLV